MDILAALGIGGIIGGYIDHILGKKREIEQHQRERKEEQYKKFLENLIGFFDGWENEERQKNFMEELYTHAPLYASSQVIRHANEYIRSFEDKGLTKEKRDELANKLVIEIRNEMGLDENSPLEAVDLRRSKLD